MGWSALAGAGTVVPAPNSPADLGALPWQPRDVLLPGMYVVAEPVGDAPWAGVLCTNWRHAVGVPDLPCPHCRVGSA